MKDVKAQFAGPVDIGMKHLADEFHSRWLVRVLLLELHYKAKGSILEGSISRSNNDGIPNGE